MGKAAEAVAIDCNFESGQVGDVVKLPSPLKVGEVEARLVAIHELGKEQVVTVHDYDLYLFGVWIGRVMARPDKNGSQWEVLD